MKTIIESVFRSLAILLVFVSAFASCRAAYDACMTSRLGTTEYYRWDIKSLDTVSIYNFRILDKGTFKVKEGIDTTGMSSLKISGSGQYSVGQFRRLVDTLKQYSGDRELYFIDLREESHCFANYYPVSWFLAQNVANKGLSLKEVEKDERSRFPKMKGKRFRLPPYTLYRPPLAGSLRYRCIHQFHKVCRYRFRMDSLPLRCRYGTYRSVYVSV